MQADKVHRFAQTMMLMCDQYQQTLSTQMLNTFWQLTQHFGLRAIQQALQTYQQQMCCQQICPTPMALLRLLADHSKHRIDQHTSKKISILQTGK